MLKALCGISPLIVCFGISNRNRPIEIPFGSVLQNCPESALAGPAFPFWQPLPYHR